MPRGGRRQGAPGQSYGQRSDLNAPKIMSVPGQTYGKQAEQVAAQRAIPMGPPPSASMPPPAAPAPGAAAPGAGAPPPMPMPGGLTPLDAPSERPDEPVTAGMAMGAGAGAEANPFSAYGDADDAALALRQAYAAYPSEDLRAILERMDLDG